MHDDTGNCAGKGSGDEGRPAELGAGDAADDRHGNAPDDTSAQHGQNQRHIDVAPLFRQQLVQKARKQAVGRQLKAHGNGCDQRRHQKQAVAQHGRHQSHHHRPPRAAEKACQQHGNVHGTQRPADLWNLSCEKRQVQAQGQTHSRAGQMAQQQFGSGICIHGKAPFQSGLPS